jgi:hypothetical protein
MAILNEQKNPSPQIESSVISIPDNKNLGTGEYKVVLKRNALVRFPILSSAVNLPIFQISLNINAGPVVSVLLGQLKPKSRKVFSLPNLDVSKRHVLIAYFENWTIQRLEVNGVPMPVLADPTLN